MNDTPTRFKLADGVCVTDIADIEEGYARQQTDEGYTVITVNISADRLEEIYLGLVNLVTAPGFAIVEIPVPQDVEKRLRQGPEDPYHKDVFYLDGITPEIYRGIFMPAAPLLIHDGMVTFGFGSHKGHDEVFVGRYKLTTIYADEPEKYIHFLKAQGYRRFEPLKTVFDTFTPSTPGSTRMIKVRGKTIYDMVKEWMRQGFYYAERRED
ncbi:MAG TPA: hypothetical protein PKW33_16505 [Anaerolineaceae bacterium]|nr:hypothetical protein [Anaerolineaceae bacterium]HPN53200.1 hypothetical protein [Anaerolineaceae bacterium]